MKLGVLAAGNAGGKITDKMLEYERETNRELIAKAVAINSAKSDLSLLTNIPESQKILIGQSEVKAQGVGADNSLGAEIAKQDISEIQNAINSLPSHEMDALLVVAGLGGGTGSGSSPVIAERASEILSVPVYGLAVLPSKSEGGLYSYNAATSFQSLSEAVDSLLLFDNEAWKQSGDSIEEGYEHTNEEIARRFVTLLAAGEVDDSDIAENVVDANEVINTLGEESISTVGYAEMELETSGVTEKEGGLLQRFTEEPEEVDLSETGDSVSRTTELVRKAVKGQLTLPCDITSVDRALILMSGPPKELSRKGVENARTWIENETESRQVRGGDDPRNQNLIQATVLLSGVTRISRIDELQEQAVDAKKTTEKNEKESQEEFDDLVSNDDLDGVL